eukprot:Hpha_TRINITY_DN7907_c0_g1::TRINITY_DN7907_c0_g1_i3::g.145974::m.145974
MAGYLTIGAARAVMQQSLATGNNLGEITAKLGTMGMVLHALGSLAALSVAQVFGVQGQAMALGLAVFLCGYAPLQATRYITLRHLPPPVLQTEVRRVLDGNLGKCTRPEDLEESWRSTEHKPRSGWTVQWGNAVSEETAGAVRDLREQLGADRASSLRGLSEEEGGARGCLWRFSLGVIPAREVVVCLIHTDAKPEHVILGVLTAELLARHRPASTSAAAELLTSQAFHEASGQAEMLAEQLREAGWELGDSGPDNLAMRVSWD